MRRVDEAVVEVIKGIVVMEAVLEIGRSLYTLDAPKDGGVLMVVISLF